MHYIPILDAGLAQRGSGYDAFADGVSQDALLKTESGEIFSGQVWPGDASFPDFFSDEGEDWWKEWLGKFHDAVKFDGLWEDMNEASDFCQGLCYQNQAAKDPVKFKLPYIPTGRDLETKSISLDVVH